MAKGKKTAVPRKTKAVARRETRSARKRRREEGDAAAEESPRKRRREEGDAAEGNAADESFEVLSGGELDQEGLTGDPTESEFEVAAEPSTPRQAAVETAKMCASDKVRYPLILLEKE